MELRHLRYFTVLAECLHFGHAAEKLHITQSTLSHQIKQLETELGFTLLQREGGSVSLTVQGAVWLDFAWKALRTLDEGLRTLKSSPSQLSGEIRVAAGQAFCASLMPTCLKLFTEKQPHIKVLIEQVIGSYLIEKLCAGEIDLGIGYQPAGRPGIVFEPLYDEELKLVVPEKHALARRKRISVVELHGQRLALLSNRFSTREMLNAHFAAAGAQPTVVVEANSYTTLLALVPVLNLPTIAPDAIIAGATGISVISLENPAPIRTFGLIWKHGAIKTLASQTFASVVRQSIPNAAAVRPVRTARARQR